MPDTKAERLIRYVIKNAEAKVNPDAKAPGDVRLIVTGAISTNGKPRKTDRASFTLAQTQRKGFVFSPTNSTRTVEITLPSTKAGRKPMQGTDLEAIKL